MIGATLDAHGAMLTPAYPDWIRRRRSGIILVSPCARTAVGYSLANDGEERRRSSEGAAPTVLLLATRTDEFDTSARAMRPESVIDRIRRGDLDLSRLERLVACIPDSEELQFSADLGFIVSKADRPPQILIVSLREVDEAVLAPLPVRRWRTVEFRHRATEYEGRFFMHTKKHRYVENPDVLRRKVTEVIRLIHQDADPHELNAYKRFVKKHVSIFSRAYFTAYLVKMLAEGRSLEAPKRVEREEPRRTGEKRTGEQAGNLVPENKQTLFVSVGKNRRVYPKDFVALFAELDGVQGDDIGQIKILDNYSFVEVDKRVAESIIETYNGFEYRGRKLTVNYARNK